MTVFPQWDGRDALALLALDVLAPDRFANRIAQPNTFGWMFGGQCMGLALAAAALTVEDKLLHAASGFFLRRGRVDEATKIHVDRSFEGRRFCAREATLLSGNKAVFRAQSSFQQPESGFVHSAAMPKADPPDTLLNLQQLIATGDESIVKALARRVSVPDIVDLRPIAPQAYAVGKDTGTRSAWFRIPSLPHTSQNMQRCLLAYLTDYWLAGTAANLQEASIGPSRLLMSSLNQSIWYYGPVDLSDWLLFRAETPVSGCGRAIARSDIFTQNGSLIASTVQEVLIRPNKTGPNYR